MCVFIVGQGVMCVCVCVDGRPAGSVCVFIDSIKQMIYRLQAPVRSSRSPPDLCLAAST